MREDGDDERRDDKDHLPRESRAVAGAERILWNHCGLEPTERFVDISSTAVRLRGLGDWPLLGSARPRAHGRPLPDARSAGWGLNSPINYVNGPRDRGPPDPLRGVPDALGSTGDVCGCRNGTRRGLLEESETLAKCSCATSERLRSGV